MRAAVHTRYGPPEVVRVTDVEKPTASEDEVLVQVHATTVNRTDCGFLRGRPLFIRPFWSGLPRPRNPILGNEFAGVVETVGAAVSDFHAGDRVFGYDDSRWGAHAEYKTARADRMLATIPEGMTFPDVAPATEGSHYALTYMRAAEVQPGSRVLIYGATGAIGSAAVQLAKHFGAHVVALCEAQHFDVVRSLGADEVLDYRTHDAANVNGPFDFVFDAVGKTTFGRWKRVMKPRALYSSTDLGPRAQNPFLVQWTRFSDQRVIYPLPRVSKQDIEVLKRLMESGAFKPVVDRTYPLDEIVDAFRYVESGKKVGNVVITVRD